MPIVFGDNWMHISEFDCIIERSAPIPAFKRGEASEVEQRIGEYVLELINDGDTIQMGLGGISEAVAAGLRGRKHLGILTEMLPLALPQLVEEGIVDNSRKPFYKGISVASFVLGDQALYEYISENPSCQIFPASHTNDPRFIAQHPNMVAMNTSLMIDFSGQSTCEGVGHTQVSGVGGQLDFLIGAYWSQGGKGINMLSATRTLADGTLVSNIVPELPPGTPVSVPRTFTNYVITEFGIAKLRYKSRRERAEELISIAHPDLRGELRDALRTRFYPGSGK
ncbi:MAG: acetyl-CoA hydrolase, partial [Syntrophomonadaceae bacterium]|nr:acetyl-CoA hydrolase [Syntrophomonadaceae bacterium]